MSSFRAGDSGKHRISCLDSEDKSPRMKVAVVQLGLHPTNPDKAVKSAETQIRSAAGAGARLVCLPEHWLLSQVLSSRDPILLRFGNLARELGIYLNLGANYEKRGSKVYLTSQTFSPDGSLVSRQDKLYLYRSERRRAVPGSRFNLVDVDGFRVAVLVCHDVVFPETARTVTLMGAELLVVPSLIIAAGLDPWLVYLRARSLENRVPLVSANAYWPPRFLGRSVILDLNYSEKEHVMKLAEEWTQPGRTFVLADLDLRRNVHQRAERLRELRDSGAFPKLMKSATRRTDRR